MTIARNLFFTLAALAVVAMLVLAGYAIAESDPMVTAFLTVFAGLPAVIVAVTSLLIGFILHVLVKQNETSVDLVQRGPTRNAVDSAGRRSIGRVIMWGGVVFSVIAVAPTLLGYVLILRHPSEASAASGTSLVLVSAVASSFKAAIPGLIICLIGALVRGRPAQA